MKVCIVKTSALGDIVQAFPVLSYLKQRDPAMVIDWVVEAAHRDLVAMHPCVRTALAVDTKRWRKNPLASQTRRQIRAFRLAVQQEPYDVVFDLQGNLKSGLVLSQIHAASKVGFGWHSVAEWPNVLFTNQRWNPPPGQNMRADYVSLVQQHFQDTQPFRDQGTALQISDRQAAVIDEVVQGGSKILVCPGSAWRNKQLPVETLAGLLQHVHDVTGGTFLFAWGSEEERAMAVALQSQLAQASTVLERFPLPVLQNLMRKVDMVIAMDSLPLHLAGMAAAPSFALFGPSSAHKYNPEGLEHGSFQGSCPYGRTFVKRCPILRSCKTGACLRGQPVEPLVAAFTDWFSSKGLQDFLITRN